MTLIGGVAPEWRTLDGTSKTDPAWAGVYNSFDVISPWYTGRPKTMGAAETYIKTRVAGDLALTKQLGIGFMPVVFPGFSWSNLMRVDKDRVLSLNAVPRLCGQFYWAQIKGMLDLHVQTLYAAMFDEVDEGTALMKAAPHQADLPAGASMLPLDADGCDVPNDRYLRLTGAAGHYLRSNTPAPAQMPGSLP